MNREKIHWHDFYMSLDPTRIKEKGGGGKWEARGKSKSSLDRAMSKIGEETFNHPVSQESRDN